MKANSEVSKTNVCKEDVLMCIFKGVPNFVGEEEDLELGGGSHHEVVMGRSVAPSCSLPSPTSSLPLPVTDQSANRKRKKNANLTDKASEEEFEIWSSPYTSKETMLTPSKEVEQKPSRRRKNRKWHMDELNMCRFAESLMRDVSSDHLLDEKLYEKYPDSDALCDECRWLVRASKSSEWNKEEEENDEELDNKFFQSLKKLKAEDSMQVSYAKNYKKSQVTKLLNEVHSNLLECSILLTVSRLRKKIKQEEEDKKENKSESVLDRVNELLDSNKPSEFEVLIDEIQEEDVEKGESKLCLALGRFISKYLKVAD